MAYCTLAGVRAIAPPSVKIDNVTTKPTANEVTQMCLDADAQIDVAVASIGGDTPVTDADLVRVFAKRGNREVFYQVMATRGAESLTEEDKKSSPLWVRWHSDFETMLQQILKRELAAVISTDGGPESETMGADDGTTDGLDPKFTWEEPF